MWVKSLVLSAVLLCAPVSIWSHDTATDTILVDERTTKNLQGVDYYLKMVVVDVYQTCPHPFIVIDGVRRIEEQRRIRNDGYSTTLNSRHLTGHAIDFVIPSFDWDDINGFRDVAQCFLKHENIEWGGDWKTFKDYGHIQVKWGT